MLLLNLAWSHKLCFLYLLWVFAAWQVLEFGSGDWNEKELSLALPHTHSLPYFPPNSCPKYRCIKSVKGMSLMLCAYMLLEINQLPATLSSRACWGAKCCKPELVWNRHGLWEQRSAFFSLTGVILSNVGRGRFQNQRKRDILALSECEGKLRYENKWNEFYSSMCFIVP